MDKRKNSKNEENPNKFGRYSADKRTLDVKRICGFTSTFQKPLVVGQFSVNMCREFEQNCKNLKYLQLNHSKVSFDLNKGINDCVRKNHPPEHLNHIFCWLQKQNFITKESISSKLHEVVICFRGLLTTIMCTPYEENEGWIICAKQYGGIIFLCAFDTEEKIRRQENETERQKQMCSWGYKFEQYMLSEHPKDKPNTDHPVNENEEWCCIFSSKLCDHKLLYAAEIDGVVSDDVIDADNDPQCLKKIAFVELKTNRYLDNHRQDRNFRRYKTLKWWCQSYLVGIETIICGFRDDSGLVGRIEKYPVKELAKLAKGLWDPMVCLNFCKQFLDFVKTNLKEGEDSIWKFEWRPRQPVTATNIENDQAYEFFPDWLKK